MPDSARDAVISGREAWQRLRERERKSWADRMQVGHALRIGRDAALQAAGTNIPFSKVYTEFMADWLRTNQFDDIGQQVRYRLLECIENLRDRKVARHHRRGPPSPLEPSRQRHAPLEEQQLGPCAAPLDPRPQPQRIMSKTSCGVL
jgi:hypothetical protein